MASKTTDEITVVAQCTVENAHTKDTVTSFDKAWHQALLWERPVSVSFTGFVRKN